MSRYMLILLCCLASFEVLAAETEEAEPRPLVQVNVSFELDAINEALESTSESFGKISDSFAVIAQGGHLDTEEQQQLVRIMDNMDQLMTVTRDSVDALPSLVEHSRDAVVAQSSEFLGELKFWAILILIFLFVGLAVAVFCSYYFVLRPMQRTLQQVTGDFSNMAKAMENTSKSLDISNQNQVELIKLSKQKRGFSE